MDRERLKENIVFLFLYKVLKRIISKYKSLIHGYKALNTLKRQRNWSVSTTTKIKVVFIIQYIPAWDKGRPLYDYLANDDRFDVDILCVPSDIELEQGKQNEVYSFFVSNGYNPINACVNNKWYRLEQCKPDYIVTFRPYDHFMPPEYSAENLCHEGKLCSILYGPPMTKELQGTVYNKDFFDYVSIFFAESMEAKSYFEKKHVKGVKEKLQYAYFCGMPILESINKRNYLNEKSAWEESDKISVLWTPRWNTDKKVGGSHFFDYKDFLIDFSEHYDDMSLMIRPHPLMFGNFEKTGEMTKEEHIEFIGECKRANVDIDLTNTYLHTFFDTDILITDLSSIIQEFLILGKPIIYCPPSNSVHQTYTMSKIMDACYIANGIEDLNRILISLLEGNDWLCKKRSLVVEELFGDTINNSCKLIDEILIKHSGKGNKNESINS